MSGFGTLPSGPGYGALSKKKRSDRKVLLWSLLATAVIVALLLGRCGWSIYQSAQASDRSVAEFHKKLNSEQYQDLYATADSSFKNNGKKGELEDFLRTVHEKLSDAANFRNINVNVTLAGKFVTGIYQSKFTRGEAVETFTWRLEGKRLLLVGYNVQSRELLRK
jgi:hypothetical protein